MNISKITQTDRNPSFGIRYNKPAQWHPEVLQALREAPIVKEIDTKYPKAIANYFINGSTGSIRTINFRLRSDMDIDILACSIFAPNAVKKLCKDIKELKLSDIEKHFPFKDTIYTTDEVENIVKEAEASNCLQEEQITSPFIRFFKCLFDPNARAEQKARKNLQNTPIDIDIDFDLLENICNKTEKIVEPTLIKKVGENSVEEILELFPPENPL